MRLNEREIHGATPMAGNKGSPLIVRETDDKVIIQEGYSEKLTLNANSARFLARKLNRLALRIEKRAASADTRPEGGDSTKIEAPFTGGATLEEGDAQ